MIGNLRKRVALQAPKRSSDSGGGAVVAYATFARVWADIRSLSSQNRDIGDARRFARAYSVRIRHRDDVTFSTRIQYGARSLIIRDIRSEEERGRFLILRCEEAEQ